MFGTGKKLAALWQTVNRHRDDHNRLSSVVAAVDRKRDEDRNTLVSVVDRLADLEDAREHLRTALKRIDALEADIRAIALHVNNISGVFLNLADDLEAPCLPSASEAQARPSDGD